MLKQSTLFWNDNLIQACSAQQNNEIIFGGTAIKEIVYI